MTVGNQTFYGDHFIMCRNVKYLEHLEGQLSSNKKMRSHERQCTLSEIKATLAKTTWYYNSRDSTV